MLLEDSQIWKVQSKVEEGPGVMLGSYQLSCN